MDRSLFLCLTSTLVISLVAIICLLHGPASLSNPLASSLVISSEITSGTYCCEDDYPDRTIGFWLCRTTMYLKSDRKNCNANRNSTIANKRELFNLGAKSPKVVCYYTIPRNKNSSGELQPSGIDPRICTHIIVGFASVVNNVINLGADPWIYERVARLKEREPQLKVMLSVGGMYEIQRGFPEMVKTRRNRKRFIRSVLNVTNLFNLDGLDVDWEFPNWLGIDDRQRTYFVRLLRELRSEFNRSGRQLLLSIAVAAPVGIVNQSYDIPEICKYVDFASLMSYDYHSYIWYFPITGHNSPLYHRSNERGYAATLNVNYSAMYWLAKGMLREKLVIGVPTYGHSYTLDNPSNHDLSAPAKGFGKLGFYGFITYPSVCAFLKLRATRCFDQESKVPYIYKYDEWVSYEDADSVRYKAEWVKENRFGGVMIFSLNTDDWNSSCREKSNENFLLTREIIKILLDRRRRKMLTAQEFEIVLTKLTSNFEKVSNTRQVIVERLEKIEMLYKNGEKYYNVR